jgi:5-methylcytosine-specific restriction endonuclease McrA
VDRVRDAERSISRHRAEQIKLLRELGRRTLGGEPFTTSGLAAALDVANDTARSLLVTARRTPELSDRMADLKHGDSTFDRAAALARLVGAGADDDVMERAAGCDLAGIHRLRALTKRIRRRDEQQAHNERHVRSWPSLDESVGFIHAQLTGHDWHVVNRALDERTDQFPTDSHTMPRDQRRADALVAIAHEWLDGNLSPGRFPGPVVTVIVDAERASETDGEAGVALVGGPRIGPDTLDRIICEGSVEILIDSASGVPLAVGPTTRVVPPKVRRLVLARDGGCTIDGCTSRYRLQVHHIVPRSRGGTHNLGNLTTLCWWHHHIAIHTTGHHIDPTSPPHRHRLLPPTRDPPQPP